MSERARRPVRMGHAAVLLACLALAACATTPPLDPAGTLADFGPHQVDATDPPAGSAVLWGGMIVEVDNRADRTEIEVLAYPLDARQRPRLWPGAACWAAAPPPHQTAAPAWAAAARGAAAGGPWQ